MLEKIKLLTRKIYKYSKPQDKTRTTLFSSGFHGDKYLLELAGQVLKDASVFIETGTNMGSTLAYVARNHPKVRCISCEPDPSAFGEAIKNTNSLPNVFIFNEPSQQFIENLFSRFGLLLNGKAAFWLDAHGYGFQWPLREEVAFITGKFENACILIDDFKVPGLEMFGYDQHGDQTCSWEYIRGSLNPDRQYELYYPGYTDRTSPHHALRGWGLIRYGIGTSFEIPSELEGKVRKAETRS